jgi:hypothetical protein
VRADQLIVRVYLGGELIKTHPRQAPGGRSTDPNDYPPGKDAYATRSFTTIIERAHDQGEHIGEYAERLFDRPLPWMTMRQGYQLLRPCDTYGAAKVDAVCERSLSFDVIDVPRIGRMLKQSLRAEDEAEHRGKLRKLPQEPRFARDKGRCLSAETTRMSTPIPPPSSTVTGAQVVRMQLLITLGGIVTSVAMVAADYFLHEWATSTSCPYRSGLSFQ